MLMNTNIEVVDLEKARKALELDYTTASGSSHFENQYAAAITALDAILEQVKYRIAGY